MSEYRLAICEDEQEEAGRLELMCARLLDERQIEYSIDLFDNAEDLLNKFGQGNAEYDLLLLDIQMGGMSGLDLAKELYSRQEPVSFIFITGCADYALEGYSVHPVHYLLKPVDEAALGEAIYLDWEKRGIPDTVIFRSGSKLVPIAVNEISYVETLNRSAIVHTESGENSFPITMAEVEAIVPRGLFSQCHNSFLVNMSKVEEISRVELRLREGKKLPVGRKFYRSFQSDFVQFVNRR